MLKPMTLSQLTAALGARQVGADASFTGVSIDSRSVGAGQLFVALTGPRFDGHDYLADVKAKGAVAALVEHEIADVDLPQLVVTDCRIALGQLGALNRAAFDKPVVAITGSSGKTTVKEMLASILRTRGLVHATRGNLNNDLGAPLTLLEISPEHSAAVIELGASRIGEIRYTVGLTRPQVVIINNAGTAHVGEFGGPEKIVEAKGEILEGLGEGGTAILNLDDKAFAIWKARAGAHKVVSFAREDVRADFYATDIGRDARGCPSFTLHGAGAFVSVQLNVLGEHNVSNALAAAAAAHAVGLSLSGIAAGLDAVQPVKGRTVAQIAPNGVRVIDDSYNANPTSMCAAIDILAGFSGRTVLVLGDIGELGQWAEEGHRQVGDYARGKVDAVYATGTNMIHAVKAFGADGRHFATQAELIEAVRAESASDTTILIKGSRSAAMENVVAALCGTSGEKH
ncbi:UDP-N-acetylmuramoyl-tripeptide--D-alanyl-D-alanine ligase [Pseudomonas plecoglossicida]|uniref:UDP-N-acetylmuramoyl-tripeptide--D-alanyl-D-alanine ligase n=1 Tax=Pseudomonas plecoglossicida TaxID=70775 RepID=A0AAD0QWK0_PSEDL|nr:UDP-N-acetylmuramoyl-tripeptide--D-alanyl-D-alanine ligase [Pseudomonas plecoglossicida]AXM96337.1 UDP-N-acetylmuramoyl-tripeptide--D-alanyl-D-alanine ligase [Pseudomonas plecoglossicida]EPB93234.1 UDP-N-acetylmuramoyl-tripeptide--D-alanyl-D-alanine ligase [Pseudomonas plecoglossicida NB2011]QLB57094.1 UDP-N-acetylmuramoyl-tripeptide--D-alanyl-D-alanine ligase [Pseudomonas plecoglossicida]GLR38069.1 UDP-N-acetylmuramoyl-tripeptide--D-alanyl-D-alanine ligase [Pseudomonas plecoglossicida]